MSRFGFAMVLAIVAWMGCGTSWGALPARVFNDPSGLVEGSPVTRNAGLFTPQMLRDARVQAQALAIEHANQTAILRRPARVEERRRSRTAFAGLDRAAAARLAAQQFPGFVGRPAGGPLSTGQAADQYVGQFSARVEGDAPSGGDAFVVSGHPLRVRDESGELAPVDTSVVATGASWEAVNPLEPYTITSQGDVVFREQDLAVDVAGASPGQSLDEAVFFADTQSDTDTLVKPLLDGVQYAWQLRSSDSPETLELDLELPDGATLGPVTASGVEILRNGEAIGSVGAAVAFDADGRPVPATLEVDGTQVHVQVEHRARDLAYPILVDPEVTAGFYFPDQGVEAASWPYWESYDNGRFDVWGGDGPYGRGLHIASQDYPTYIKFYPGTGPADAENAGLVYNAPGQARIYKVYNTQSRNITGEFLGACMLVGIAYQHPGGWAGPYGQTYGEGCSPFAEFAWTVQTPNGAATAGNRFIFGAYAYSDISTAFQMYFRDAEIRMYDEDAPTITQVNAPTDEWLNSHHSGGLRGYATDPSTGVKRITFSAPNGWSQSVVNPKCAFGPCSRTWDNGGSGAGDPAQYVPVANLPEGRYEVQVTASDPAGNGSAGAGVPVAVDHSGPAAVSFKGAFYDASTQETTISWNPSADPALADGSAGSGTMGYEYRYTTGGAPTTSWQETGAPQFVVPGTTSGQAFAVEVRAVDQALNTGPVASATLPAALPADTTAPTLSLSGPLFSRAGQTVWDGYWDVTADAQDANGSGVAQIAVTIDGQHMRFDGQTEIDGFEIGVQGQICGTAGCSLRLADVPFDTAEYATGPRVVTVTATDFSGNATSQSFAVVNSHLDDPTAPVAGSARVRGASTEPRRPGFTVYSAGPELDGLEMTSGAGYFTKGDEYSPRQAQVTYWYGSCEPQADDPCTPPIQVQSSPQRLKNVNRYRRGPAPPHFRLIAVRGVPAAAFDGGRTLEIYAGRTTITIYGDTARRVRRFARRVAPARDVDVPAYGRSVDHIGETLPVQRLPQPVIDVTRATARETVSEHYDLPQITNNGDNCSAQQKDPINVAFVGTYEGGPMRAVHAKLAVFGDLNWTNDGITAGSKQWARDPGTGECEEMDTQAATNFFRLQKHHVRFWGLSKSQNGNGVVAMGAHRDIRDHDCGFRDTVPAKIGYSDGRVRTGFDVAQREFLDAFGQFNIGYQDGPGQYTSAQCNPRNGATHQVPWNGRIQVFEFDID